MRVSLVRSGGFSGIRRSASLSTEDLDPKRAARLRNLAAQADLGRAAEPTIRVAADRFRFTLTVEEGDRSETVTYPEDRIPENVRPLIDLLWREADSDVPGNETA
jgi:hypothetical protein